MSGVVPVVPLFRFDDAPLGSVTVYAAGTTTLVNTFQDAALTTLNTNPVPLNAKGECTFWTDGTTALKFLVKDAAGATVSGWPVDNIPANGAFNFLQAGTGAVSRSAQDKLRETQISVKDFGAVGDGVTDDGTAFNACATQCRAAGKEMFIPAGSYIVSTVDITGVSVRGEGVAHTTVTGKASQDVFYWKGSGESGAIRINKHHIRDLAISVDGSADVRGTFLRVAMSGHKVGNCAIFLGGGNFGATQGPLYYRISNVSISQVNGGAGTNGCCGLFMSEAVNGLELSNFKLQLTSFGIVEGVSNKFGTNKFFVQAVSYDAATDTFTATAHGLSNTNVVALLYSENAGTFTNLSPRTSYFVVNATTDTFQLSLTSGGAAIDFSVATGAPVVFFVRSGASGIEYAPDVRNFEATTCKGTLASMVLANGTMGRLGKIEMQSGQVAMMLLNFPSLAASAGAQNTIDTLYVEGPTDGTFTGKEYWRFEWNDCQVLEGMALRGSGVNTAKISGNNNFLPNIYVASGRTLTVTGNNNECYIDAPNKETQLVDTGAGNRFYWLKNASGGDAVVFAPYRAARQPVVPLGGWAPDYLEYNPAAPYRGRGVQTHLMYQAKFQSAPATLQTMFDDAALEVAGYVRDSSGLSVALAVRNPWSIANTFLADQWYPRAKFRLHFRLRGNSGATPTVTLGFQKTSGTGGAFNTTKNVTLTASWASYFVDVDASALASDVGCQISVTGANVDWAYFHLQPWRSEALIQQVNYGNGVLDLSGAGTPEGSVTAPRGSTYRRTDGGAATSFYVKESGTGNTGWVGK